MPELRGMTWDHPRGFDPMVATSAAYAAAHPGVTITWDKRSLQAFADQPLAELAATYDLLVIDHPHVGDVAAGGHLLALDRQGRDRELAALAQGSVGLSHVSYAYAGHHWALAIDTATPVACVRSDVLGDVPTRWDEVVQLARQGQVALALKPINALMTFFGLARNLGYAVAEDPDRLMNPAQSSTVLGILREIVRLVDQRCLTLDPVGIYDWMGHVADAPAYSAFGYGYTNYSRAGFCPYPLAFHDAPGIGDNGPRGTVLGGTGIAVSAQSQHRSVAVDYAFWIASGNTQRGLYTQSGGQPAHAAAWDDDVCNALTGNFFRQTRRTLDTAWLRLRYDGYMQLQDRAGDILHACLRGEATEAATLAMLDQAYRDSRS